MSNSEGEKTVGILQIPRVYSYLGPPYQKKSEIGKPPPLLPLSENIRNWLTSPPLLVADIICERPLIEGREARYHWYPAALTAKTEAENRVEPIQLPKEPKQLKLDEAEPDAEVGTIPKIVPPPSTT